MRATRAYLAGIGTAGALALGAALVFAAASAIIAFRGWPGTDISNGPARQVLSVTPPPSGVARRLAHIATTAKQPAVPHHHLVRPTRSATHGRATSGTGVHHRVFTVTHRVSPTHHRTSTTTPRTTTHGRTHHVPQPRVRHRRGGGPLHSKSYPTSTQTTPTTAAPTTPPTSTAPTVTTAVTTAPTTTSTTPTISTPTTTPTLPVTITVGLGHGHTVTITVPSTTPSPVTTPTGPPSTTPTAPSTTTQAPDQSPDQGQGQNQGQGQAQGNNRPGWAGAHGY